MPSIFPHSHSLFIHFPSPSSMLDNVCLSLSFPVSVYCCCKSVPSSITLACFSSFLLTFGRIHFHEKRQEQCIQIWINSIEGTNTCHFIQPFFLRSMNCFLKILLVSTKKWGITLYWVSADWSKWFATCSKCELHLIFVVASILTKYTFAIIHLLSRKKSWSSFTTNFNSCRTRTKMHYSNFPRLFLHFISKISFFTLTTPLKKSSLFPELLLIVDFSLLLKNNLEYLES